MTTSARIRTQATRVHEAHASSQRARLLCGFRGFHLQEVLQQEPQSQTPRGPAVPADVLGCLLVGAVDQQDRMVPRYVAAREDRMKLDPDGPQSRVQGHGQDQELSGAAHLHVYVLLLTCLQVIGTFAAGLIRFDYQPPPQERIAMFGPDPVLSSYYLASSAAEASVRTW